MKFLDEVTIAIGLSATLVILFFLIYSWDSCFILFEPILPIRIIEIIWCIFGIYGMIKILIKRDNHKKKR